MSASGTATSAGGPPSCEALAESLRAAVGQLVRGVRSQTGTPHDAQGDTLAELDRDGPRSIAALAASRSVTHQSMRLVIGRLEEAGLLERRPDPADGRGWLVVLTDEGRRTAEAHRAARSRWLAAAIDSRLSPSERAVLGEAVPLLLRLAEAG